MRWRPDTPAEPDVITVTGDVVNETPDGVVPVDALLTLHMFDPPEYTESTLETTLQADGTYAFTDVPHMAGRAYLLSLQVDDVFFSSTVYTLTDAAVAELGHID